MALASEEAAITAVAQLAVTEQGQKLLGMLLSRWVPQKSLDIVLNGLPTPPPPAFDRTQPVPIPASAKKE